MSGKPKLNHDNRIKAIVALQKAEATRDQFVQQVGAAQPEQLQTNINVVYRSLAAEVWNHTDHSKIAFDSAIDCYKIEPAAEATKILMMQQAFKTLDQVETLRASYVEICNGQEPVWLDTKERQAADSVNGNWFVHTIATQIRDNLNILTKMLEEKITSYGDEDCCFCLDPLDAEECVVNECGHRYHKDCFNEFRAAGGNKCPLCRHPIKLRGLALPSEDPVGLSIHSFDFQPFDAPPTYRNRVGYHGGDAVYRDCANHLDASSPSFLNETPMYRSVGVSEPPIDHFGARPE
jgi:hypothetical protein